MAGPNKVLPSICDNELQPEIVMWPIKLEVLLSPEVCQTSVNFDGKLEVFDQRELPQKG